LTLPAALRFTLSARFALAASDVRHRHDRVAALEALDAVAEHLDHAENSWPRMVPGGMRKLRLPRADQSRRCRRLLTRTTSSPGPAISDREPRDLQRSAGRLVDAGFHLVRVPDDGARLLECRHAS